MSTIVIRSDASSCVGSGHVMRCRSLGRALKKDNHNVIFVCRPQDGDLIELLKHDFRVLSLPPFSLDQYNYFHEDRLVNARSYDQISDANETLALLRANNICNIRWVLVDHYSLDADWEHVVIGSLNSSQLFDPRLFVIDDLANRKHIADILLDQNMTNFGLSNEYNQLVPEHCKLLLGSKYAILGEEYALFHDLLPIRTCITRILVYFGGVDEKNLTLKTLNALLSLDDSSFIMDIVRGQQVFNDLSLHRCFDDHPRIQIHDPLPSLAGLLARSDLAIGAAGTTTFERLCLKVPSVVIPTANNQLRNSNGIKASSSGVVLPSNASEEEISSAVSAYICDSSLLQRTSANAAVQCNGSGIKEIVSLFHQ